MADHFIREFKDTLRQSPLRAALALVILITTTVYVCTGQGGYRVAEIGNASEIGDSSAAIDLASDDGNVAWVQEIEQVTTDEEDVPAVSTRVDGRDRYIDARLTHAVAVDDDISLEHQTQVIPVSGESQRRVAPHSPVWLLGVLGDD